MLSLNQVSELFDKNKSTISRHIKNICDEGELEEFSCVAKNATQQNRFDPRTGIYGETTVEMQYHNLDVIII